MPVNLRIILLVACSVLAFTTGWMVHGWKYSADQLEVQTAKEKAFDAALKRIGGISQHLQLSLDELDKKRILTTKEIFHETTKTDYRCVVPPSGISLYNSAAAESADTSKP